MNYLSVCSGIEAATQAWHPLGWRPVAFSEIERFPSDVLAHHYPDAPNWGDMTKYKEWPDADIDVLVGGTPCQSFSVAGLRKGLADPRGNLMLTYGAIAARYRPSWLLWENVPGVLSSDAGRDFGSFLGLISGKEVIAPDEGWSNSGILPGIADAYGIAWRVLDAQHVRARSQPFAVPQRRRRVFVVGYLGDWRRAAAVLFDGESMSGHPPPRRKAGQGFARGFECGPTGGRITDLAPTLDTRCKDGPIRNQLGMGVIANSGDVGYCGTPLVTFAIQERAVSENPDAGPDGIGIRGDGASYTIEARQNPQAVAFDLLGREGGAMPEGPHDTANIRAASGGSSRSYVAQPWAVRRLTPKECERLQGFPDDFTRIPNRGKPADKCPDGPRYKAIGNSMAVNCMSWLGERINEVDGWQGIENDGR